MDDVRPHPPGKSGERGSHPEAPQHGHAEERIELLEPMHLDPLELAARIDAARGDVDLVALFREAPCPAREMAGLSVSDPEDAQPALRHRG
jgi:hypothetical protein